MQDTEINITDEGIVHFFGELLPILADTMLDYGIDLCAEDICVSKQSLFYQVQW